ncbi:unnamed protein product [Prunus brigantina]
MGETQREMMDTIKELKNAASKPSEEDDRHPQEESTAAGKVSEQKGPSFVTQEDVVAMLEKELSRSQEDWKKQALLYEHALGPHAGDYNLRLREFSKSLIDRAYTWYTTLAPGSMPSRFCEKKFQHEVRVTTTQLNNTRQKQGEDPVDFV